MGMVNVGARRRASNRKRSGVTGVCLICGKTASNALVVKGKPFTDGDGNHRVAADSLYHRECFRMQTRGLLNAGIDSKRTDSTGKRCGGCNTVIESGDPHAHRSGVPYHRECLL